MLQTEKEFPKFVQSKNRRFKQMNKGKHYTPENKILILRELLENNIPFSKLADKYEVHIININFSIELTL